MYSFCSSSHDKKTTHTKTYTLCACLRPRFCECVLFFDLLFCMSFFSHWNIRFVSLLINTYTFDKTNGRLGWGGERNTKRAATSFVIWSWKSSYYSIHSTQPKCYKIITPRTHSLTHTHKAQQFSNNKQTTQALYDSKNTIITYVCIVSICLFLSFQKISLSK